MQGTGRAWVQPGDAISLLDPNGRQGLLDFPTRE